MKKFTVLALALLLVVAFTVPASALENIFGGYWRTRMYQDRNFEGDDGALSQSQDAVMVDTRTRLYYTAKLNDNLKLVNKFEMDSVWGTATANQYGRPGTDAISVEVKNSYADFNVGPVNFLVGAQYFLLGRGLLSGEDGIGMKAIWKVNDGLYLPFVWNKFYDGNSIGVGEDRTRGDIDQYIFTPIIMLSKDIKINPYYVFIHGQDALAFSTVAPVYTQASFDNLNAHIFGLDFDGKFGPASVWFTGIWMTGSTTATGTALTSTAGMVAGTEIDVDAYALYLGGKFDLGKADIHANFLYATGDDDGVATDKESSAFLGTTSQIFTWAEILSGGVVDNQVPTGAPAPANKVSNVMALNLGTKVMPTDKLSIIADLWYAKLAEDNAFGEDKLGLEVDVTASYKLVEGLTLDVIGAYLFAGDAISADGKNETNPYELITQLSLSF